ncbi:PLP-dependent aminotransferase family protein [Pseudodesulfovibrio tunisiensis]|uniref:aminotransferase-like domain-containing protein n=1 Tax=Pseudodesulfovibrio tunisiensis TaxID=463192 RepID=UPI001FB3C360|nr:PLP-dependent aminotransferase family protein [Pseudodesulfovibrio tunisiensis]
MTLWRPDIERFPGPRYLAIADVIEEDVSAGRIGPGFRLPTHRCLAERLGVTVGTVTRGYAEAARRGLVRGETGRGTYIASRGPGLSGPTPIGMDRVLPISPPTPDIAGALGGIARSGNAGTLLRPPPPGGRMRDRETGSLWLERWGLPTPPETVVPCINRLHALTLLFSVLFRKGDRLAVTDTVSPLIRDMARRTGVRLVPIPCDENSMLPDALDAACAKHPIRAVHVMPGCQDPTTASMNAPRRAAIAEVADRQDLLVIEDDPYAHAGTNPLPVTALIPERAFFVADMTMPLSDGLAAAFASAPRHYVESLQRCLADTVGAPPVVHLELVRLWLEDGTADRIAEKRRSAAMLRSDAARKILEELDIRTTKHGYFLWIDLPEPWTPDDFCRETARRGISVSPAGRFTAGRTPAPCGVRAALSSPRTLQELERGLATLRDTLKRG